MSNENKKIEDYLHLYLGCMFVLEIRGEKGNYSAPIYFGVDALLASTYHTKYGDKIYPILILRPLSDMTEEEILQMTLILMSDVEDKIDPDECNINLFHNDDGLMVDADIAIGAEIDIRCFTGQIGVRKCGSIELWDDDDKIRPVANQPMAFKWMLAKGFDLFGLIELGLAIDKTTLNVTPS